MKAVRLGAAGGVLALVAVSAAVAAAPAGTPDPRAIVLTAADFPGLATDSAARDNKVAGAVLADHENDIRFKKPYGASKYLELDSEAAVETDAVAAGADYAKLAKSFSSKAFRTALQKQLAQEAKVKPAAVQVVTVKPHGLGVGDASMEGAYVVSVKKLTVNFSLSLVRLDRVIVVNVAFGLARRVVAADATKFAALAAAHGKAALVPISITVPGVSGTALQGQTLTASNGTWGDAPTAFGYQWQSCDATGVTCTDIPAATAATYGVQPTDATHTLRVVVTATNRFGSASSNSGVTAAVG